MPVCVPEHHFLCFPSTTPRWVELNSTQTTPPMHSKGECCDLVYPINRWLSLSTQVCATSFNAGDHSSTYFKDVNTCLAIQLGEDHPITGAVHRHLLQTLPTGTTRLASGSTTLFPSKPSSNSQQQPDELDVKPELLLRAPADDHVPPDGIVPFSQLNFEELLTPNKMYLCPICMKEMRDKFYLRRHYMIHTGEKPFACSFCQYRGKRKEELHYHIIRKHTKQINWTYLKHPLFLIS